MAWNLSLKLIVKPDANLMREKGVNEEEIEVGSTPKKRKKGHLGT